MFIHGFYFDSNHLFVMMISISSVLYLLQNGPLPQALAIRRSGSRVLFIMILFLFVYALFSFMFNWINPYQPQNYAAKSAAKAYFETFGSMFAFGWMLSSPYGFTLRKNWPRTLLIILWLSVFVNVAIRGYMFAVGFQAVDSTNDVDKIGFFDFNIPIINMIPGVYTLRNLSPLACLIFLMISTIPGWWIAASRLEKFIIISGCFLCLVGAVFSGGRATLPICIFFACAVAFFRRRMVLLVTLVCSFLFAIAAVNIFSQQINTHAPHFIARSVQMVMLDKGTTYGGIVGSQESRNAARDQAFIEWRGDDRIFLIGRSVYKITAEEAKHNTDKYGMDGFVMNAIWTARTHDMISELLLQYGLAGFLLYIMSYCLVIIFFYRLYKNIPHPEGVCKALAGTMVLYLPPMFISQIIGGGYLPLVSALFIGLIRSHLISQQRLENNQVSLGTPYHPSRVRI
jgi:hypothetical protein